MPEDRLTEEEKKVQKETEDLFRSVTDKFLSKVYSMLSWCWPATIAMFLGREVLRQFGYYGISNWAVTVFLWLPFAITIGSVAIIVGFLYLFSLFYAWIDFVNKAALWFKTGFADAIDANEKKKKNEAL